MCGKSKELGIKIVGNGVGRSGQAAGRSINKVVDLALTCCGLDHLKKREMHWSKRGFLNVDPNR